MNERDSRNTSVEERRDWEKQKRTRDKVSALMGQYLLRGYRMLSTACAECGTIILQTREGKDFCIYCTELKEVEEAEEESGTSPAVSFSAMPSPAISSSSLATAASTLPAREAPTTTASPSSPSSSSSTPHTTASSPPTAPLLAPTSSSPAVTVHATSSHSPHVLPEVGSTQPLTAPSHRSPSQSLLQIRPDNNRVTTPLNTIRGSARTNPATRSDLLVSPDSMQPQPVPTGHTQAVATQRCTASLISKLHWVAHELETCQSVEYCTQLCQLITACGQALTALQESSPHQCSAEHKAETSPEE